MPYDASPQAIRPLLQSYWSSQGWRRPPQFPDEPIFEIAVSAGVMFSEPVAIDHDAWVSRARAAVAQVTAVDVGAAFIASLETRRLDLRSALGSYAVARHLPTHEFTPTAVGGGCGVCGLYPTHQQDLNVLNFERFKWGGVRHDDVAYLAFDLEQFAVAPQLPVTESGLAAGRELVAALRSAAPKDTATKAAEQLRSFPSNKAERAVVMDILGVSGILLDSAHPSYRLGFVRYDERALPDQHFIDRAYPACWWRGSGGLDDAALREFLSEVAP
jgi:hypothetical protein